MEKEIKYQTSRIFYRVFGNGKPVMLLHGFGVDGNLWKNQVDHLKNKFQLIIPDLPGSGRSEVIEDMSIEGMAEVIKKIIDQEFNNSSPLGGNQVKRRLGTKFGEGAGVLIGHSMGGYITLAIAEKYPDYLRAFGLDHSTAYADSEEKKVIRDKAIQFIQQHGSWQFLKATLPNLFSKGSQAKIPGKIKELIDAGNNFSPAALVSYYQAMKQRPDRTETLKNSRVPVLFIMGKYDEAAPLDDVLKQCHLPEKSYIHILHHTGHMGML
jgi:pimeloyl-ACP methyl ester carboxylesterase